MRQQHPATGRRAANYHSAKGHFPPGRPFPDFERRPDDVNWIPYPTPGRDYPNIGPTNRGRYKNFSVHVWLLPYIEQANIYKRINFEIGQFKRMFYQSQKNPHYQAYAQVVPIFLCPSDANSSILITENNYRCNFGGSTFYAGAADEAPLDPHFSAPENHAVGGNGAFTYSKRGLKSKDFADGLSKTAFFSERTKGSGHADGTIPTIVDMRGAGLGYPTADKTVGGVYAACSAYVPATGGDILYSPGRWREGDEYSSGWPFAGYDATQYNHVAEPNWKALDCGVEASMSDTPVEHAIVAARSEHAGGGVLVAFGDAHTMFVTDGIDLTVWRALGTRNGDESLDSSP